MENRGPEHPGVLHQEKKLDVSAFGEDYTETFLVTDGMNRLRTWLKENVDACPEVSEDERLGPPLSRPGKIICIGLNYRDHAEESNMEIPKEPIIFFKATSAIVGPYDDLILPRHSEKNRLGSRTSRGNRAKGGLCIGGGCHAVRGGLYGAQRLQ